MTARIDAAREFLWKNARLLERRRFAFLFEAAPADSVLRALVAYQNADGGFGNGLEPDLRGPTSQPIPAWTALWLLDEIDRLDATTAKPILSFLTSIELPGGGVPFTLRSASDYPHAPWWETDARRPPASLNPTAGIAAALYRHRIRSPWLDRASAFCWNRIERIREVNPYELRVVLSFLDRVPERARARTAFERLRPKILSSGVVEMNVRAKGDVFRPLDVAPEPGLLSRELFPERVIEQELDALEHRQGPDGGWTVGFPIWTPITKFEWRGVQTVEMLKTLRANGRLPRHRASRSIVR
jgi:hypothetical protein